jgi:hypothetical protein
MTQLYKITLLSLALFTPQYMAHSRIASSAGEKTLAAHYAEVDGITVHAISNDGKQSPAAFKVTTPDSKVIVVKPNGKKHKKPYTIGSLQGTVQNGKLSCPLPQTPWYEGSNVYELESMRSGNEKHARIALLKNGETTVAIIEVLDDNAQVRLIAHVAPHSTGVTVNNRSFLKEVKHHLANALQLKAEVGRAAQRMLHQK